MNSKKVFLWIWILIIGCNACSAQSNRKDVLIQEEASFNNNYDTTFKTIHIFVALCDNKYQGIVPVPKAIGNGQDPDNNLYWGCGYGIRTFFKKSKKWKFVKSEKIDSIRLERLIFKHISKKCYIVADAYNGKYIKQCTHDFLNACAGKTKNILNVSENLTIGIYGNSKLVAYIGHDGLMDFSLNSQNYLNTDNEKRDAIILACYSKKYFSPHVKAANANSLVWSTYLMSPEAYTLHDALTGYINNENAQEIRKRAAKAYSTYQKCGEKAALNLLVTGF